MEVERRVVRSEGGMYRKKEIRENYRQRRRGMGWGLRRGRTGDGKGRREGVVEAVEAWMRKTEETHDFET